MFIFFVLHFFIDSYEDAIEIEKKAAYLTSSEPLSESLNNVKRKRKIKKKNFFDDLTTSCKLFMIFIYYIYFKQILITFMIYNYRFVKRTRHNQIGH